MRRLSPHLSADGRCGSLHRTHPTSGIVENIPQMPGLSRGHTSIITDDDSCQFTTNSSQNSRHRTRSCVGRRIRPRPTTRPGSEIIEFVRRLLAGASASFRIRSICACGERAPSLLLPLFARARPPPVSHTHSMLTLGSALGLAQRRIEGLARWTSIGEASHNTLFESRTRAARAGIAAGIAAASSCIPLCAVCVADRSGRPADRLCFPPLPSQVRSRPTTSSARAAGDLAAASRWPRAAPSPSMAARARVDEVLRGSRLGRSGARDGGSWPPRTRRVAV